MNDKIEAIILPLIAFTITLSLGAYFLVDSNVIADREYEAWFYQYTAPSIRQIYPENIVQEIIKNHTIPQLDQNPFKFQHDAWITLSTITCGLSIFSIMVLTYNIYDGKKKKGKITDSPLAPS